MRPDPWSRRMHIRQSVKRQHGFHSYGGLIDGPGQVVQCGVWFRRVLSESRADDRSSDHKPHRDHRYPPAARDRHIAEQNGIPLPSAPPPPDAHVMPARIGKCRGPRQVVLPAGLIEPDNLGTRLLLGQPDHVGMVHRVIGNLETLLAQISNLRPFQTRLLPDQTRCNEERSPETVLIQVRRR